MFFLNDEGGIPAHEIAPPQKRWGEAWSDMAGAIYDLQQYSESANNQDEAMLEAYRRRNTAIHQATGVQLDNPVDIYGDGWRPRGVSPYSLDTEPDQIKARAAEKKARWLERAAELKQRFPDRADLFDDTVETEALAITRGARERSRDVAEDPTLGWAGRLSAVLAGGGAGMLRDPTFVPFMMAGAPAAAGRTVAGRIGRVMLFEAAINAGGEAAVQAIAEPWKARAGVETSWQEFFVNAGLAGAFGAGLGGGIQGAGELYRVWKLKVPAREAADRIMANRPEPGDVEEVAAALGRQIPEDHVKTLARSFEEDALDGYIARTDATPEELMVAEAARRFAEDPDNYPPPEVVERMLADKVALKNGTIAEYGRTFDLEETFAEGAPAPIEGRLAPEQAFEPLDDADLARAETLARGEPPALPDAVESPAAPVRADTPEPPPLPKVEAEKARFADYDDDGVVQYRTLDEWLDEADIPARHADLLEACKL